MATFAKIKENYFGVFWGVIVATLVVFVFKPTYSESIDIIRALPQLTTCIFGFLLTLLGIILQGDGPVILSMRGSIKVYNRFIGYNKKIVILSFILTIIALIAGYVSHSWLNGFLLAIHPFCPVVARCISIFVLTFCSVWLIVDLMIFVKLFYLLIKQSK